MLEAYIEQFREAAESCGIRQLSFYVERSASRSMSVREGELEKLELAGSSRLMAEGEVDGLAGSVFVENFQPELIGEQLRLLRETALALGRPFTPLVLTAAPEPEEAPDFPPLEEMTERLREAEKAAQAVDSRVEVLGCGLSERRGTITLSDGRGAAMTDGASGGHFSISVTAREGEQVQLGGRGLALAPGARPDFQALAREAAEDVIARLDAASYRTGRSPAVLDGRVVCELLDAFAPAFFFRNVRSHTSVLEGRLGQPVAGEAVTLEEDPALPGGLRPRRFDDEGVPTRRKTILDRGVLQTYLYDRRSAAQAGEKPGGNGFRTSFSQEPSPGYTNLVLRSGEASQAELLEAMGEGLLITNVSGVFAGAHPATGEFSLIARGYRVREGRRREAVSQITIAGDFFELLRQVRGVGSDRQWMRFANGCVGTPSLFAGELAVSGEEQG